jgi:hypothetical protein
MWPSVHEQGYGFFVGQVEVHSRQTGQIGLCEDAPPHVAAKADLARIETVRLSVAIQVGPFF